MRDGEIDDILSKSAATQPGPDPALLDRIAGAIRPTLQPVRPMPPARLLEVLLYLIALAIAVVVAARIGFYGFRAMSGPQIFVLAAIPILIGRATVLTVAEMIPGARAREASTTLFVIACATMVALFAILFRNPMGADFVHWGVGCLKAGVITAIPVALAVWLILRRGFPVNPGRAAVAAGTLAGLAGVGMLELHCPNFQTWHVVIWHTAVIPVTVALTVLLAKLVQIGRGNVRTR